MANEQGTEKIKGIFNWKDISMTENQEKKWEDMRLKSLEAELRSFPEVEVPKTLEYRLLAAIPDRPTKVTREYQVKWQAGAWDFGTTATAAVLILALMFIVNYGLSMPPKMLITELNDTSLCYTRWDQNSFLYDQNNACVEKTLPYKLTLPRINTNESVY